jgi:hypothetical protein
MFGNLDFFFFFWVSSFYLVDFGYPCIVGFYLHTTSPTRLSRHWSSRGNLKELFNYKHLSFRKIIGICLKNDAL